MKNSIDNSKVSLDHFVLILDIASFGNKRHKYFEPKIELAYNKGFGNKELKEIESLINKYQVTINSQINLFRKEKTVKSIIINK